MWSQATGIHSIKPSLKIDAPTPAQPPPRLRGSLRPPPARSTQLGSRGDRRAKSAALRRSGLGGLGGDASSFLPEEFERGIKGVN